MNLKNLKGIFEKFIKSIQSDDLCKIKIKTNDLDFNFGNIQKNSSQYNPLSNILDHKKPIKIFDIKTGSWHNYTKSNLKI